MIVNFSTWSDADFIKSFSYVIAGTTTPISLVGNTLQLKVRRSPSDHQVVLQIDNSSMGGIVLTDAVNGKFEITLPKASLGAMPAGTYYMALLRTLPDSRIKSVWHGTLNHQIGAGT